MNKPMVVCDLKTYLAALEWEFRNDEGEPPEDDPPVFWPCAA